MANTNGRIDITKPNTGSYGDSSVKSGETSSPATSSETTSNRTAEDILNDPSLDNRPSYQRGITPASGRTEEPTSEETETPKPAPTSIVVDQEQFVENLGQIKENGTMIVYDAEGKEYVVEKTSSGFYVKDMETGTITPYNIIEISELYTPNNPKASESQLEIPTDLEAASSDSTKIESQSSSRNIEDQIAYLQENETMTVYDAEGKKYEIKRTNTGLYVKDMETGTINASDPLEISELYSIRNPKEAQYKEQAIKLMQKNNPGMSYEDAKRNVEYIQYQARVESFSDVIGIINQGKEAINKANTAKFVNGLISEFMTEVGKYADDVAQLQTDIEYYLSQHPNATQEEAEKACLEDLRRRKEVEQKTTESSKYDNPNGPKIENLIEPKTFLNAELKNIKECLVSANGNSKKVEKFKEYLKSSLIQGPLLSNITSQFEGESAKEYKLLLGELNIKVDTISENVDLAKIASELIENELIPALVALEELDGKREELRTILADLYAKYKALFNDIPEKEIEKSYTVTDNSTNPPTCTTKTKKVTNPDYTEWLEKKADYESKIDKILNEESITIGGKTVNGLIGLDALGEELSSKCYKILGDEVDLEKLVKDFNKKSGGNRGGNESNKASPTSPPSNYTDNAQDQLNYYKQLSDEEIKEVTTKLSDFAKSKNISLAQLLTDQKNANTLVKYVCSEKLFKNELINLISVCDPVKTQQIMKNIFLK